MPNNLAGGGADDWQRFSGKAGGPDAINEEGNLRTHCSLILIWGAQNTVNSGMWDTDGVDLHIG